MKKEPRYQVCTNLNFTETLMVNEYALFMFIQNRNRRY